MPTRLHGLPFPMVCPLCLSLFMNKRMAQPIKKAQEPERQSCAGRTASAKTGENLPFHRDKIYQSGMIFIYFPMSLG